MKTVQEKGEPCPGEPLDGAAAPDITPRSPEPNTWLNVLFVGDPNLGDLGENIVRRSFRSVTALVWDIAAPDATLRAGDIRRTLRSSHWDLCISFYNDLVFDPLDLARIKVPLNIHPATPDLPGVGHDTVPLIERHDRIGATLHIMEPRVDSGPILQVIEQPLPAGSTRSTLRALTQSLCLQLLEQTCSSLEPVNTDDRLDRWVRSRIESAEQAWRGPPLSRQALRARLDALESESPEHAVFR